MAIRIEHGSVMPALSLARIAGRGQATQQRRAADLALLDFGLRMEAQRDRREAQERAFSLQLAAARRRDRTPMARAQIKSPFADPVQKRIENERAYQVARQNEQLERIKQMVARGEMSSQEAARNELRVRGGQSMKFGEEEISISERLFAPRARMDMLKKQLSTAQAWAADPDASDEDKRTYTRRVQSIQAQIEKVLASVGQPAQTVDPKTGEAAPTTAMGPQATTKRLVGQSSEARMKASTAKAGRLLASFPSAVRDELKKRGLDTRELAVWHYNHGNFGHPKLAEIFVAAGQANAQ